VGLDNTNASRHRRNSRRRYLGLQRSFDGHGSRERLQQYQAPEGNGPLGINVRQNDDKRDIYVPHCGFAHDAFRPIRKNGRRSSRDDADRQRHFADLSWIYPLPRDRSQVRLYHEHFISDSDLGFPDIVRLQSKPQVGHNSESVSKRSPLE